MTVASFLVYPKIILFLFINMTFDSHDSRSIPSNKQKKSSTVNSMFYFLPPQTLSPRVRFYLDRCIP